MSIEVIVSLVAYLGLVYAWVVLPGQTVPASLMPATSGRAVEVSAAG
jgi:hypothetical protein